MPYVNWLFERFGKETFLRPFYGWKRHTSSFVNLEGNRGKERQRYYIVMGYSPFGRVITSRLICMKKNVSSCLRKLEILIISLGQAPTWLMRYYDRAIYQKQKNCLKFMPNNSIKQIIGVA